MLKTSLLLLGLAGAAFAIQNRVAARPQDRPERATLISRYPSGSPRCETSYAQGQRHGVARGFYPDGKLEFEGEYVRGERSGTWTYWTESGAIDPERSGRFEQGRRTGPLPTTP